MKKISSILLALNLQLSNSRGLIFPLFMLTKNNAIAAALSYTLTISLANILGPSDFGIYSFVLVIGSILSIVITFGTDLTAPMMFAKIANRQKALSIIFGIRLSIILITALGLAIYSFTSLALSYYILCLLAAAFNLSYLYESMSNNIKYSYIYLTERLSYISLVFIVIYFGELSLSLVFSLILISSLVSILFQYSDMRVELRCITQYNFGEYFNILKINYPLVMVAFALFCYGGFSKIIIENKFGTTTLGIYSAGWQLISIGTLFQMQVTRVWRLKISTAVVNGDNFVLRGLMKSYIVFTTAPLLALVLVMLITSKQIVSFLFSPSYHTLAEVLPILGVYLIVINFAGLAEMLWIPVARNKSYMAINVFFGAMLLLILHFLPSDFGLVGFAVSTVTIHFAATIVLLASWLIVYRGSTLIKITKNG